MDQVEAQLKKIRTKLDDVPAFQQAEVSWPCLGGWTRSWEEELLGGRKFRSWLRTALGVRLWSDNGIVIENPDQLPSNQSRQYRWSQ